MVFLAIPFYFFVLAAVVLYYAAPLRWRWLILLGGSLLFYYEMSRARRLFLCMVLVNYGLGLLLDFLKKRLGETHPRAIRWVFAASILATALPLLLIKNEAFVMQAWFGRRGHNWVAPLGLSFYSLQMIAYLADIYKGTIRAEQNLLKYTLFLSFFPQMVQGPIPRFDTLAAQLTEGHRFCERDFTKGLLLILWGFFLKLMLADRAAVVVDTVFGHSAMYGGGVVFAAGVMYSIQLYTDFSACVCMARGVAELFGIHLSENFRQPYFSRSIKEFWQRWHMSLSHWLRDYIYIPLGGSRRGRFRRYLNLMATFAVSGIWHGAGYKYLAWGLLHACYQIAGEITAPLRERLYSVVRIPADSLLRRIVQRSVTLFLVMTAWILFRADSLREGLRMVYSMVTVWNPWIFFDDTLLRLGLGWKEWGIFLLSLALLWKVSCLQQEKRCVRDWILEQHLFLRWAIYLGAVLGIFVFGAYGYGFDAQAFIYGGF